MDFDVLKGICCLVRTQFWGFQKKGNTRSNKKGEMQPLQQGREGPTCSNKNAARMIWRRKMRSGCSYLRDSVSRRMNLAESPAWNRCVLHEARPAPQTPPGTPLARQPNKPSAKGGSSEVNTHQAVKPKQIERVRPYRQKGPAKRRREAPIHVSCMLEAY